MVTDKEEVNIILEVMEVVDIIQESMEEVVIIPDITAIAMTLLHSPLKELIVVVEE